MPATSTTQPRSCLRSQVSVVGTICYPTHHCIGFDRSDQKNHSSRTITVPPRGCRVKQTVMCLFTMSKDPVADTSQCQHNQTCSLSCDVFLGLGFGDHRATMVKWWSQTGSNRRHPACKAGALPAELWPHILLQGIGLPSRRCTSSKGWWARVDSNYRPHAYQACALTT